MNQTITAALTNLAVGSTTYFLREHLERKVAPAIVLDALEALSDGEGTSHTRALRCVLDIFAGGNGEV